MDRHGYWSALMQPGEPPAAALERLLQRPAWHRAAACRGQGCGPWFPTRGETVSVARAFCAACPVRAECAEAGRDEPAGIWAGDSARARRPGRTAA